MTRVFVGNLAWSVTSQELQDHLAPSGGVLHADVLSLPNGRSKGSGVVTFDTEDAAARAIQDMTDTELNGRLIWLREFREEAKTNTAPYQQPGAQESTGFDRSAAPADCNVHVGNLPWSTTTPALRELCEEFGELQHAEVVFGRDGRSRGYGAVVFCSPEDASRCIDGLHGTMIEGRDLTVRISKPRGDRPRRAGGGGGAGAPPVGGGGGYGGEPVADNSNGYKVFVGNMPWSITWQDLKDLAKDYGDVAFADVVLDYQGRSRGMGTITFNELQDAHNCIETMNGLEVDNRKLLVKEDNRNPLPSM